MKKLFIFLLILMLSFILFACSNPDDGTSAIIPSNVKVSSISLNENSFKSEYLLGETIDYSNASVTVYYSDSSSKQIGVNENMVRDFNTGREGIFRGYIAYAEKETSFLYTVVTARLKAEIKGLQNPQLEYIKIGVEVSIEGAANIEGGISGMLLKITNASDRLDIIADGGVETELNGLDVSYYYTDNDNGVLNFIFEDVDQTEIITEDSVLFTVWFDVNNSPSGANECIFINASLSNGENEYVLKTLKVDELLED